MANYVEQIIFALLMIASAAFWLWWWDKNEKKKIRENQEQQDATRKDIEKIMGSDSMAGNNSVHNNR